MHVQVWVEILGHKLLRPSLDLSGAVHADQLLDPIGHCERQYGVMEQFWQYAALLGDKGGDSPSVHATNTAEERKKFHAVASTLAFALLVNLQPVSASLQGFSWRAEQQAPNSSADVIKGISLSELGDWAFQIICDGKHIDARKLMMHLFVVAQCRVSSAVAFASLSGWQRRE